LTNFKLTLSRPEDCDLTFQIAECKSSREIFENEKEEGDASGRKSIIEVAEFELEQIK
jgi:hypothetical protein